VSLEFCSEEGLVAECELAMESRNISLDYKHEEYVVCRFQQICRAGHERGSATWFRGNERLSMRERWMDNPEIHNVKNGLRPFNGRNHRLKLSTLDCK
jgi:hypothetical protein